MKLVLQSKTGFARLKQTFPFSSISTCSFCPPKSFSQELVSVNSFLPTLLTLLFQPAPPPSPCPTRSRVSCWGEGYNQLQAREQQTTAPQKRAPFRGATHLVLACNRKQSQAKMDMVPNLFKSGSGGSAPTGGSAQPRADSWGHPKSCNIVRGLQIRG